MTQGLEARPPDSKLLSLLGYFAATTASCSQAGPSESGGLYRDTECGGWRAPNRLAFLSVSSSRGLDPWNICSACLALGEEVDASGSSLHVRGGLDLLACGSEDRTR